MTSQKIIFKNPVSVLQIFQNINIYGKENRSYDTRRDDIVWKEFSSESGYVSEGELFLPKSVLDLPNFPDCGLITIEDSINKDLDSPLKNRCIQLHHPNPLHIFQLKQKEELELHLKYDDYSVGIPRRNDFKICDLRGNHPIEIKINGKTDFSMTSGRARVFKEQLYIFELLGRFNYCHLLREPLSPVLKKIPVERKLVDLLKPLW